LTFIEHSTSKKAEYTNFSCEYGIFTIRWNIKHLSKFLKIHAFYVSKLKRSSLPDLTWTQIHGHRSAWMLQVAHQREHEGESISRAETQTLARGKRPAV
jgi:hypothetical protein